MTALADTSFVVAVLNRQDNKHQACLAIYQKRSDILLLPTALTEVAYLLKRERGPAFLANFLQKLPETKFQLISLNSSDIQLSSEVLVRYADIDLDFVDASIFACAERLRITTILTLDQRDFRIFRPKHCDYFEILP
jgi:predicted nucleic acid-binding protein